MTTIVWAIVILVMAGVALYLDNRYGEPGMPKPSGSKDGPKLIIPRIVDNTPELKYLPRIRIPKPKHIGQEDLLTGVSTGNIFGYALYNNKFRPIIFVEKKNSKWEVYMGAAKFNRVTNPVIIDDDQVYITEAYPGHYAELVRQKRLEMWVEQSVEMTDARAHDWLEQSKDERPPI